MVHRFVCEIQNGFAPTAQIRHRDRCARGMLVRMGDPDIVVAVKLAGVGAGGAATGERVLSLHFDPVCAMVTSPARARATVTRGDKTYYFCSENCRDCFERDPDAYLGGVRLDRSEMTPRGQPGAGS